MITSEAQLDACIGAAPAAVNLKIIDHLDAEALRWLRHSTLAFVAGVQADGLAVTLAGGAPGFALQGDKLVLPRELVDDVETLRAGQGAGLLFLVPGIGETLRVNGRIIEVASGIALEVQEVFLHCAKALLRSAFWSAAPLDAGRDAAAFLRASRFVAVATSNAEGLADLSPKGDPAGNMLHLDDLGVSYAERPGNKRADSLRNMLAQPRAATLALIPGSTTVLRVRGQARLLDESAVCAAFAVEGKTPKLVTRIEQAEVTLRESPALLRAAPWPLRTTEHGIDPAAIFTAHVKLNKTAGLAAKLMRAAANKTLMGMGLAHDYKNNMY